MKPTLYLETTIPSYLTARPSRDVIVLAHQEITREWWSKRRYDFALYISPVVLQEATLGDAEAAELRGDLLSALPVLEASPRVEDLARTYFLELHLPDKAIRDAAHLAFATAYEMDYLLTWNCAHIANAEVVRQLARINARLGIPTPTVCTPEELSGTEV